MPSRTHRHIEYERLRRKRNRLYRNRVKHTISRYVNRLIQAFDAIPKVSNFLFIHMEQIDNHVPEYGC